MSCEIGLGHIGPRTKFVTWHGWLRPLLHYTSSGASQAIVLTGHSIRHSLDILHLANQIYQMSKLGMRDSLQTLDSSHSSRNSIPLQAQNFYELLPGECLHSLSYRKGSALLSSCVSNKKEYSIEESRVCSIGHLKHVRILKAQYVAGHTQCPFCSQLPGHEWASQRKGFPAQTTTTIPTLGKVIEKDVASLSNRKTNLASESHTLAQGPPKFWELLQSNGWFHA